MCGIVASVSSRGRVSSDGLARAAASLVHRGPDAQAVWTASNGRAGLGHSRLSIIDLTTGDQPLHNEDDSIHIVVNGEFYDFERIRTELQAKGHCFKTRSDSEIALHLYEDLGARAMHQLRGEFAFALWDERDGVLFAGRDRFGIKPLYYALVDGTCHVASEVKALKALGVPLRWDREALYDIHYGLMHAPSRSAFDGIYQVPPGCYLLTDGVHAHVHTYWDWNYPPAEVTRNADPREAVERLSAVLEEAVRLRLRADVPVACYLSGGLDSCTVLGIASKLASNPLRAYTLSFDMADYDERAIAEAQAKLSGAEFYPIPIRSEQLADHLEDALYHAGASVRERALGGEVPAEQGRARLGRQGGDDGRGRRRSVCRLSVLPPRSRAAQHGGPGSGTREAPAGGAREGQPGLGGPAASDRRCRWRLRQRAARAGVRADDPRHVGTAGPGHAEAAPPGFRVRLRRPRLVPLAVQSPRRRRPAHRSRGRQPGALHLGQDVAAQLHPQQPGRPDGDGALGRGPAAVSRSQSRRGSREDARVDEDQGHDREVRAARGGQARAHRRGVPPAEASVPLAAGDAADGGLALRADSGHAARPGRSIARAFTTARRSSRCSTRFRR